jgi:hypothetical protein
LYRDTTEYPPLQLTWSVSTAQTRVTGVFPHPVLPQCAVLTTETGVLITEDAGQTWTALPQAAADKVGPIRDVAFHPISPDTFYLASQTKGVWATTDKGKTFSQIGAKAQGMASDTVVSLSVYPGDVSHQTLLAVHGKAAPGLSRSRDGGKAWDVVNTDYCFNRLLSGDGNMRQLYLFGSTLKEPDIQSVYSCTSVGEFVAEVMRDVVPTDMVFAPTPYRKSPTVYLTTSDSGLYRIDDSDAFGSGNNKPLPMKDLDGWASVGVTWGPSADAVDLFLYDPTKLGLVVTPDDLATFYLASNGLPVNSLVKEGAVLRPNANGTVFYNVANAALAIGRAPEDVPVVNFTPMAFEINPRDDNDWRDLAAAFGKFVYAKGPTVDAANALCQSVGDLQALHRACQLSVTARVPLQPSPPASVTLDLSRFGGSPDTPLFDDGQHDDGAPNDGVYGTTFSFLPGHHRPNNEDHEWRNTWPGRIAMGIVATYADGKHRGAVGVVNVSEQIFDSSMWDGVKSADSEVEGGVTAEPFLNPPPPNLPVPASGKRKDDVAVRLTVPKGPWKVSFKIPYNKDNINSYAAISFYLHLDAGEAPRELYLQLRDGPEFSLPTTTDRVPILHGTTLNAEYQRFVVPMTQLLGTAPQFQADHLSAIIISGETDAPATLVIEGLQALTTYTPPSSPGPAQ